MALRNVIDELGFTTSVLSVHDFKGEAKLFAATGMDAWLDLVPATAQHVPELWGGPSTLQNVPLEEPVLQSEATPRSAWRGNPYYEIILKPMGVHDIAVIPLIRDSTSIGVVGFGQLERHGEVTDDAKNGLRLFAPHLRRAVIIGRLFERQTMIAATLSDVIEALASGIVLVDQDLAILHANAAARGMLDQLDPISSSAGKLKLTSQASNEVLAKAVRDAMQDEAAIERRSIDIPLRRANGTAACVQVLPLRRRNVQEGFGERAVAAVFISNPADPPRLPGDALAMLYDLTPAETRVFELIVDGKTPDETAHLLHLKLSTVRTHLSRVFDKTGCTRQVELVALAARARRIV
jgi:DNA-binding CsgD family transcriptional regulator